MTSPLTLANELIAPRQRSQSVLDLSKLSLVVGKGHDQRLVVTGCDIQCQTKILQQREPEIVCSRIALLRVQVGDAVHRTHHLLDGEIDRSAERETRRAARPHQLSFSVR
jgi:hypothetical protein